MSISYRSNSAIPESDSDAATCFCTFSSLELSSEDYGIDSTAVAVVISTFDHDIK